MRYAVHVPTQADYDKLMTAYKKKGWRWFTGEEADCFDRWTYREETCVSFEDGCIPCPRSSFQDSGFTIITLNQALTKLGMTKTLETLEVGDWVKKDGDFQRVLLASGEGELRVYLLSLGNRDKNHDDQKETESFYTAFELKRSGFTLDTADVLEVDLDEIAAWKGVSGKQIRIKKTE
jgi:hypothetical protein